MEMDGKTYFMNGAMVSSETDNYGNKVKQTKENNPYNYSDYVQWQHDDSEMRDKTNGGAYTDRLYTWDYEKYNRICNFIFGNEGQYWRENERSHYQIEQFMREYVGDNDLVLTKVVESCNVATGYPVWYFAYYRKTNNEK